tara:strand:+ start:1649 stop:2266 length:618 start_codon:yes stop_codon:yes gene_type:complete
MSRKTLLTETEIRQFLKLANLGAVGDTRIQEMSMSPDLEDLEEEAGPEELDKFAADDLEDDTALGDEEAGADELEADSELDAEMGGDMGGAPDGEQMVSVSNLMSALEGALEDVIGEPVETEVDMEQVPADDDEMEMDLDVTGDGGEMDVAMDVEEEPGMRDMYENQDALVKEVARRVATRLKAKNDKTEMVDALAERIMKRLTK